MRVPLRRPRTGLMTIGQRLAPRLDFCFKRLAATAYVILPFVLAACSGGGSGTGALPPLTSMPLPKVGLPTVDLANVEMPKVELPEIVPAAVGSPTDVYIRVARGVLTCWFGAKGPLKERYIYNADTESHTRGGRAEITIHERDTRGTDPRGSRAARITIEPDGQTTKVGYENFKLQPPLGDKLQSDVHRWAADRTGCEPITDAAAWTAATAAPAPAAKAPRKKQAARAR